MTSQSSPVKQRLFEILEPARPGDRLSRLFDLGMMGLLAITVLAAILYTVARLAARRTDVFDILEVAAVTVFTLEYVLRVWTGDLRRTARRRSPLAARMGYVISPHGVVDLLAFLPFFVTLVVTIDPLIAHVLPILRVLKYMRYSPALETLGGFNRDLHLCLS